MAIDWVSSIVTAKCVKWIEEWVEPKFTGKDLAKWINFSKDKVDEIKWTNINIPVDEMTQWQKDGANNRHNIVTAVNRITQQLRKEGK